MNQVRSFLKLGLLVGLSLLGSALPFLVVAPLVRVANRNYSRSAFISAFSIGILVLVLLDFVPVAISLMAVTVLIGLFTEVHEKTKNLFIASFVAIAISALSAVITTQQWLMSQGSSLSVRLQEQVELVIKQAHQVNPTLKLDATQLLGQAPSVLIGLLIMSLALAIILELPISKVLRMPTLNCEHLDLVGFRLPDAFIWIAMVSFLLSFVNLGKYEISIWATNIVNVMVVLYFFQGLAVVEAFFTALRLGFFIRFLTYVVFLIQLFFLVAAIGVIDFWVEFRKRFIRIRINS